MKKYDNYKDSGVEWIGEIPEHWKVKKLKYVSNITRGAILRPVDEPAYFDENGEWTYLNISDATLCDKYLDYGKLKLSVLGSEKSARVQPNNLIITASATIGKPFINRIPVCVHDGFIPITELKVDINFLFNYFTNPQLFNGLGKSNTQKNIYLEDVKNLMIPIPSEKEQTQIANYLDHKTTQIDNLISKKEQFITLLQEERIVVINQAVTKGLDPNVKLKDSGIEWLGEIPEHWEVKRLRNLVETIKTGSTPPSEEIQYFEPKEINWYGPGDFDNLILGSSKRKISKLAIDENKCRLFPTNSILLIGIGATVGKVGLALEDCSSNQQINAIILKDEYNPTFYLYFLSTIKDIIVMEASSATLPIFNQTQTKNIIIPVPPTKEQLEISNYIRNQEIRIEVIISKTQQEIELLKEYKTALISEVVTGKVDVRNEIIN
jgi:type I restriction enzyme S subunit